MASRKDGQTVYYHVTNQKFIEACALMRQALVEQHLAQGESLQAAELLDAQSERPGAHRAGVRPTTKEPRGSDHDVHRAGGRPASSLENENTSTKEHDMSEDLTNIQVEKVVDARGTSCPGPILAAKKGIPSVSVGGVMEVQATDTGTTKDLPAWSKKMGHEYLGVVEEPGYMRLFVKKMK